MKKNYFSKLILVSLSALMLASCGDDKKKNDETTSIEISDETMDAIVTNYVDAVVLPTYKDLAEKNAALYDKVVALKNQPSDAAFADACDAWLDARQPWETSEAFLFGPVDELGLDPNMDSWPLDQDAIENILTSGNFSDLNWTDGDSDDAIEAAQGVRGFHTLEFLLFKDGQPRTLSDEQYAANKESWGNYLYNVATLLKNDSQTLYDAWSKDYQSKGAFATTFKSHNNATYSSAINCIQEMLEGCQDIAGEVGTAKIGDPYDLYQNGKKTEALYAVESWYSWHSRDDYTNNILSVRNTYFGTTDGTIADNSLSKAIAAVDIDEDTKVKTAINTAANAIQAIPQPFRNNINSKEAETAMQACADLVKILESLEGKIVE
ncbi:MAG: peptidase M75 [Bacteroidales bacterium]|nr:peptidase M75 [Bacteroidales bacterium]